MTTLHERMSNCRWRNWIATLLLILPACRTPMPDTLAQREVATMAPDSGAVSLKLVPDPDSPNLRLGPDEDYVPPQLHPSNPPPIYPEALIPHHLNPQTVIMRVTFDEQGRVARVEPSPLDQQPPGPQHTAFAVEVREALLAWRCFPPRIRKFRDGPDNDGDGKADFRIMEAQRFLKTFFDVSFTFEIVNGVPVVRR